MKQSTTQRCNFCNRTVKPGNGRVIYPLGLLGDECATKFAALPTVLERLGLGLLAYGPITLEAEPAGYGDDGEKLYRLPQNYLRLRERATKAGLSLRIEHLTAPRFRVELVAGRKGGQSLETACGSYAKWSEQVRQEEAGYAL